MTRFALLKSNPDKYPAAAIPLGNGWLLFWDPDTLEPQKVTIDRILSGITRSGDTVAQTGDIYQKQSDGSVKAINSNLFQRNAYFVVSEYGAVGDGVTNDTTAIQNAINGAYTAGGGKVFIPAGTYLVNELTYKRGVSIIGAGSSLLESPSTTAPTTLKFTALGSGICLAPDDYTLAYKGISFLDFTVDMQLAGNCGLLMQTWQSKAENVRVNNIPTGTALTLGANKFIAGNPTQINITGHGMINGDYLFIGSISQGGLDSYSNWASLSSRLHAVTVVDGNNVTIPINSVGFPAYTDTGHVLLKNAHFVHADGNTVHVKNGIMLRGRSGTMGVNYNTLENVYAYNPATGTRGVCGILLDGVTAQPANYNTLRRVKALYQRIGLQVNIGNTQLIETPELSSCNTGAVFGGSDGTNPTSSNFNIMIQPYLESCTIGYHVLTSSLSPVLSVFGLGGVSGTTIVEVCSGYTPKTLYYGYGSFVSTNPGAKGTRLANNKKVYTATLTANTYTPDMINGSIHILTLDNTISGGTLTVAMPTNSVKGDQLDLHFIQDATGGISVALNASYKLSSAWDNTGNTASKRSHIQFQAYSDLGSSWTEIVPQLRGAAGAVAWW